MNILRKKRNKVDEMTQKIFTVAEINRHIKGLLDRDQILSSFWLKGELSNFTSHSSGHMYFTIKDESGSIRCVMFRSRAGRVRFKPANGQKVVLLGYISLYEKSGQYQVYVEEMIEDGIGDLYEKYEELKKKLEEEGLFALERKRSLPFFPDKIAVITSPTGAAVRDIITVIQRRMPSTKIILLPAQVQGTGAAQSICQALEKAWQLEPQVIIAGRGGGSIEELWAFNEEEVVRKIAQSPIPIISAVGHETDFTLSDFAADLRAATPSIAAELAVPDRKELANNLWQKERRIERAMENSLAEKKKRLENILRKRIIENPERIWEAQNLRLEYLREKLLLRGETILKEKKARLEGAAGKIDLLSPLKTLSRGYSIAFTEDNKIIKESDQLSLEDKIKVKLHKGQLLCRVTEVKGND